MNHPHLLSDRNKHFRRKSVASSSKSETSKFYSNLISKDENRKQIDQLSGQGVHMLEHVKVHVSEALYLCYRTSNGIELNSHLMQCRISHNLMIRSFS